MLILHARFFFLLLLCGVTALVPITAHAEPQQQSPSYKFGVISLNHPLVMYRQYLPFTDYLSEQLSSKIELFLAKDYQSIIDALVTDEIEFALLAGVSYVDATKAGGVVPICSLRNEDGSLLTRSIFVTRTDRDDIHSISDLTGKSFAFGSQHSTSSYLQPLGYLYKQNFLASSFSSYDNLPTQDAVVRSVLRGTHDGGAISMGTYKRFADAGLKEIDRTSSYPGFVIVASSNVERHLQKKLQEILLKLDYQNETVSESSSRWSPLLQYGCEKTPTDSYKSVSELMAKLKGLGLYR